MDTAEDPYYVDAVWETEGSVAQGGIAMTSAGSTASASRGSSPSPGHHSPNPASNDSVHGGDSARVSLDDKMLRSNHSALDFAGSWVRESTLARKLFLWWYHITLNPMLRGSETFVSERIRLCNSLNLTLFLINMLLWLAFIPLSQGWSPGRITWLLYSLASGVAFLVGRTRHWHRGVMLYLIFIGAMILVLLALPNTAINIPQQFLFLLLPVVISSLVLSATEMAYMLMCFLFLALLLPLVNTSLNYGTLTSSLVFLGLHFLISVSKVTNYQREITTMRNAAMVLRKSEKRYRSLFTATFEGVAIFDQGGLLLDANPRFLDMFGHTMENVLGKHISFILPTNNHSMHKLTSVFASHGSLEGYAKHSDGSKIAVEMFCKRHSYENVSHAYVVAVRDVSAQRMATKKSAESESKTNFLAMASHELRNPLNVVYGFAEKLMAAREELPPRFRDLVRLMSEEARSLRQLIDDLIDLARIESNRVEFHNEPFSVRKLIYDLLEVQSVHWKAKSLRVIPTVNVPELVLGDSHRVAQVLRNLVSNAIKFTQARGLLSVSATMAPDELRTPNGLVQSRGMLHFVIADGGKGIATNEVSQLFQLFSQAESGQKQAGSGLGLYICKHLVEQMGGQIWVRSKLNVGTTFSFVLPLKVIEENDGRYTRLSSLPSGLDHLLPESLEDSEGTLAQSVLSAQAEHQRSRDTSQLHPILVAEDLVNNRTVLSILLEDMPYDITYAIDGYEAVETVKANPNKFKVILMDVGMPRMDGYQATKVIRAWEQQTNGKRHPIVFCTAHASKAHIQEAEAAGGDGYVTKPIDIKDLLAVLEKHCGEAEEVEVQDDKGKGKGKVNAPGGGLSSGNDHTADTQQAEVEEVEVVVVDGGAEEGMLEGTLILAEGEEDEEEEEADEEEEEDAIVAWVPPKMLNFAPVFLDSIKSEIKKFHKQAKKVPVDNVVASTPEEEDTEETAAQRKVLNKLKKMGHGWKGSGKTVGMPEVTTYGKAVEDAGKEYDLAGMLSWVEKLEYYVEHVQIREQRS